MKISFDMDGVLAGYCQAFTELGRQMFGLPIVTDAEAPQWDWEKYWATREQVSAIWKEVKKDPHFWSEVSPLIGSMVAVRISRLMGREEVYFVTARPDTGGSTAQNQTKNWIEAHIASGPSVVISNKKGKICEAIGIKYHIDDKFTYCLDIVKNSPKTRVFLLEREHNKWVVERFPAFFKKPKGGRPEITVVKSVSEYLDKVEG